MSRPATIREEYGSLSVYRESFVDRAIRHAEVTIPSLFPRYGSHNQTMISPHQSLGAQAVANLAARLNLALFPPNSPFMRYEIDGETERQLNDQGANVPKITQGITQAEKEISLSFERSNGRTETNTGMQHLIVTGNAMFKLLDNESLKMFKLDQYVIVRDAEGEVLKHITHESVLWETLPDDIRRKVPDPKKDKNKRNPVDGKRLSASRKVRSRGPTETDSEVGVYTKTYRTIDKDLGLIWKEEVEINDIKVDQGQYVITPYFPLRWIAIAGEDYGRSHVEESHADLIAYDSLAKSLKEAAKAMSKIIGLRRPNAALKLSTLSKAKNGDWVTGNPDDAGFLQINKFPDMRVAFEQANELKMSISESFMLNRAAQRSGERVTATEIRAVVSDLENALGGVYSHLAKEFQNPYVSRLESILKTKGKITNFSQEDVRPVILTGLEALGREADLQRTVSFVDVINALGPEAKARLKMNNVIQTVGNNMLVDTSNLLKTEKEYQEELRQLMLQQAAATGSQAFAQQGGQNLANQGQA